MEQKNKAADRPAFFNKKDIWVIGGILVAGIIGLVLWLALRTTGAKAEVTIGMGTDAAVEVYSLQKDAVLYIEGGKLPVTLQIKDGRIRFIDSECPDHICENTGWLQYDGETATCIPAGVWVQVVE